MKYQPFQEAGQPAQEEVEAAGQEIYAEAEAVKQRLVESMSDFENVEGGRHYLWFLDKQSRRVDRILRIYKTLPPGDKMTEIGYEMGMADLYTQENVSTGNLPGLSGNEELHRRTYELLEDVDNFRTRVQETVEKKYHIEVLRPVPFESKFDATTCMDNENTRIGSSDPEEDNMIYELIRPGFKDPGGVQVKAFVGRCIPNPLSPPLRPSKR